MTNSVTGGRVWNPYALNVTLGSKKVKYPNLYWRTLLTIALIGIASSLYMVVSNFVKAYQVTDSIEVDKNVLTYVDNGPYLMAFGFSSLCLVLSIGALISSFSLKGDNTSKVNFFELIFMLVFYSIVPFVCSIVILGVLLLGVGNAQSGEINSWIDKELGVTYQMAEDSNLSPYRDDYYSSNVYLNDKGKNFHLRRGMQDGNKTTLMFVEVEEELEFFKDNSNDIYVKR
jgi:hypothetical protein